MGMNISAKLIYGLTYDEFEDQDRIDELIDEYEFEIDEYEFDYASPYYDAPREEWLIGIRVGYKELQNENEMLAKMKKAKEDFFKITGQDGLFFVTQHVY